MIRLSVIIPTVGRPTLIRTLESVVPQLRSGDEIIVLKDDTGDSGNSPRDDAMPRASGTHLWFLDDDDIATPTALQSMRRMASSDPYVMWVFRMLYGPNSDTPGEILWRERKLEPGNVGSPCALVPNTRLPRWTAHNGEIIFSDIRWIMNAAKDCQDVRWSEDIVAHIRP